MNRSNNNESSSEGPLLKRARHYYGREQRGGQMRGG
eukprot:CAMPEP_0177783416 /NCGR_PEP_ID=MMETSP0491_2-20121128/19092_1 /TAXON_ID=63592 /ORGANISM="Tetraselmis chuii, Strain PLY429" /LENGTH=35 /DNA_ID= /DNA_START= /DNA_END= /DNA_ORIENTATION=